MCIVHRTPSESFEKEKKSKRKGESEAKSPYRGDQQSESKRSVKRTGVGRKAGAGDEGDSRRRA